MSDETTFRDPQLDADTQALTSLDAQQAPVPFESLPPARQQKVRDLVGKIDVGSTQSILAYGVEAQKEVTASADQMLQRVRNKDVGPVGDTLNDLMLQVRGLGIDDLRVPKQSGLRRSLVRGLKPIARFIQRYESIQSQIDSLIVVLESHKSGLLRDVGALDKLYAASLRFFHDLEDYIIAGEHKLKLVNENVLPRLKGKADETGDMLDAQALRDMVAARDDLERRVHDLKLTRTVTMQSLPQIRLIQDVDKSLVNKIQSSILTTIPVWKSQIAIAITLFNQRQALETQRKVTETTNEMLAENAEMLKIGSAEARKEIERGMFDIETVKKVNADLITTIQESIAIAQEGHRKRIESDAEMARMEDELKQTLLAAEDAQTRMR
ncbi:MAG: toxic anion resistance protein [Chloroflexi bacterium]|nr:toxic anion resistance protein [Chloroflexota bacterium]